MTFPDPQTLYFGMLTFVLVLLILNEWAGHREKQRARARRNNLLHFDPAKTAGGHIGKYPGRTSGFGDQVYWQADRELEVPPDAATEIR